MRLIGEHYSADPATLREKQVRDDFVFLIRDKELKSSVDPAGAGGGARSLRALFEWKVDGG